MADNRLPDEPPATEGYTLEAPKPRWRPDDDENPRPEMIRAVYISATMIVVFVALAVFLPIAVEVRVFCFTTAAVSAVVLVSHLLWLRSH